MKHPLAALCCLAFALAGAPVFAWDGFDADSADLVEITPDAVPSPGDYVDVRDYESDDSKSCVVTSVTRNRRTIEVVVTDPEGKSRTLVMESR